MKRLVQWADIIAENFTPGVMDRLDLGKRARLAARNEAARGMCARASLPTDSTRVLSKPAHTCCVCVYRL